MFLRAGLRRRSPHQGIPGAGNLPGGPAEWRRAGNPDGRPAVSRPEMGLLLDPEGRLRPGWRLLLYLLAFSIAGAMASVLGSVLSRTGAVPRWAVGALVGLTGGGLCVLLFWLLRRAVDRRPWSWLGLVPSSPTFALLGWGLVSGVAMLGALFAVETVLGWIEPSTVLTTATLSAAAGALFASMGIGVLEELLLRGAVLQNLGERFPLWAATLATGVLFGLLHLANPAQRVGVGVVVSAVVATLMLTLSRFVTGSLAWAIGWHAGWDWAQDLLGIAEPGASRPAQWVSVVQRGPAFWTGVAPSIEEGHWPSFSSPSVRPLFGRLPGEGGQSTGSGRFSTGNRDGLWSPVRGRGDRRFFVRP